MKKLCPLGHLYSGNKCNQCNSTASRGYDHRWRKLSEYVRTHNPVCVDCDAAGRTTPSKEVHHIIPITEDPSKRLDPNNLVALCIECHNRRHGKNS